jgi:hypothetical protein
LVSLILRDSDKNVPKKESSKLGGEVVTTIDGKKVLLKFKFSQKKEITFR